MRRLAILGTVLGALFFSAVKPADAQVIYRPGPLRGAARWALPPYGYYYGPRYYYGSQFYGPGYYRPWGGYYYW